MPPAGAELDVVVAYVLNGSAVTEVFADGLVKAYVLSPVGTVPGMTENQSTETTVTETVTTTEPDTVEVPVETPAKDEGTVEVDAAAVDPQE